jgi:glycerate kinase
VHVVVAPDKFKGSLSASQVASALAAGLRAAVPDIEVVEVPVADGGDGTLDAAVAAGYSRVPMRATGPTGSPVQTAYAVRDGTAVVELADVCGLSRLPGGVPAALDASTEGLGEVIRAAVSEGARRIIIGVGGSASTDGGSGMLRALGARLLDVAGNDLPPGGGALQRLHRVVLDGLDPRLTELDVVLASDVDNPLIGPRGAAAVYAPQKGATPADVPLLEGALTRWSGLLSEARGRPAGPGGPAGADRPGAGAAGGVGFAAITVLDATFRPGIDLMLELTGFREHLAGATLVITGEGSLDEQTLSGKAPAGVAAAAREAGVPTVAVAGRCLLAPDALARAGISRAYALTDIEPDPARSMTHAGPLLVRLARRVADDWLAAADRGLEESLHAARRGEVR